MELMKILDSTEFRQWIIESIVLAFFAGGIVLVAIGVSLLVNSAATLRVFGSLNRWVSMRRTTKPLEMMHDTRSAVLRYRHVLGTLFVIGGIFSIFGLLTQFDYKSIIYALSLEFLRRDFAEWLLDSIRWALILGNAAGIGVGLMLLFAPDRLARIEQGGSKWFSERQATRGADKMNVKLDPVVASYPRAAGGLILFIGVVLIAAFGLMMPKVW